MMEKLPSDLAAKMSGVFLETAQTLVHNAANAARERVLSKSRRPHAGSGRYLNSIRFVIETNPLQVTGKVGSNHPQAAVLEFGSRPHVIQAKNKATLFWPGARFPVKKVNHPGTPAFKVLGGAAEQVALNAQDIFNQVLNKTFG